MTKLHEKISSDAKLQTGKVTKESVDDKINAGVQMENVPVLKDFQEGATLSFNAKVANIARAEFFKSARAAIKAGVITSGTIYDCFVKTNHFAVVYSETRIGDDDDAIKEGDNIKLVGTYNGSRWYQKENELTTPRAYWNSVNSALRYAKAINQEIKKARKQLEEFLAPAKLVVTSMSSFGAPTATILKIITKDKDYQWITPEIVNIWREGKDLSFAEYLKLINR